MEQIQSTLSSTCLQCGKALHGRIDKKFCNQHCRNYYNNTQNSMRNTRIKHINHALQKNHRILESLLTDSNQKRKMEKDQLTHLGFQFRYHTHAQTTKDGRTVYFCYDKGFQDIGNEKILLVSAS